VTEKSRFKNAGHQEILGETIAKLEFFKHGWNPYTRFLDHEKIDFVVRKNTKRSVLYADIQVKKVTLYRVAEKWQSEMFDVVAWRFFGKDDFRDANPNLAVALVFVHQDQGEGGSVYEFEGDLFIFKASELSSLIDRGIESKGKVKMYLGRSKQDPSRWYWCREWRKGMSFGDESVIEVTHARGNLELLDEIAFCHKFVDSKTP